MIKRPIIDPDLAKEVQEYANLSFDGNFTKAVNQLIRISLAVQDASNKRLAKFLNDSDSDIKPEGIIK